MSKKRSYTYDDEKANTPLARFLRERVNDPQRLAKHLGCSIQAVNQYKNGTAFPKVENLILIAEFYGVSLDELVGNSPNDTVSKLVTCGFSLKAAKELAILSNPSNGGWAARRFSALNRLIEETSEFEAILSGLELCLRFEDKTITPFEAEFIKRGESADFNETRQIETDRAIYRSSAMYTPQYWLGKIAERFLLESEERAKYNAANSDKDSNGKEGNDAISTEENK